MTVYRTITGTIKDAQGAVIASGELKVKPLQPLTDDDTFLSPEEVTVTITNGTFTLSLAAPNNYDFLVIDQLDETVWNFKAPLDDDVDTDISLAELYLASRTEEDVDITALITQFLGLFDTPSSFVGQAGKALVVNGTEDGIEFV